MEPATEPITACEAHSVQRLAAALDAGLDPRAPVRGRTPVQWLLEMYARSERFPQCLRLLLDRGAVLDDPRVAPVLLDDPEALATALPSAFTPLESAAAARRSRVRQPRGAARAAPRRRRGRCAGRGLCGRSRRPLAAVPHRELARRPRAAGAADAARRRCARRRAPVRARVGSGLRLGDDAVRRDPISYAQCGLLPQMHRDERQVYETITLLLRAAGRAVPPLPNVPNRYLAPKA